MLILVFYCMVFIGLYAFLAIRLIQIINVTKNYVTIQEFFTSHTNFEGIAVLIEGRILIGDAVFYRKVFSLLKRRNKLLVIRIDFEDESTHEDIARLISYFGAKGVTSIYYHNQNDKKLIFDLSAHPGKHQRDIYLNIKQQLMQSG